MISYPCTSNHIIVTSIPIRNHPVGLYSGGLIWGRIVDFYGPRIPLACSFLLLVGGYSGIRYFYDSGLPAEVETLSNLGFIILVLCSYLTGCGSSAGSVSTMYWTAKSFPDRAVCL